MTDLPPFSDFGLTWLDADGDHPEIVLSTRVRLARNLQGHAFGPRARVNDREAVLKQMRVAGIRVPALRAAHLVELPELDSRTQNVLLERRVISRDLMGDPKVGPARGTAVVLDPAEPLGVMLNEELQPPR